MHKYGLRNRPAFYGNVPDGFIGTEPDARFQFGVVAYDTPLTEDQMYNYELVPADSAKPEFKVGDQVRILKWFVFGLDRYMQKARAGGSIGTVTFITEDKVEVEFPEGLDLFPPEALVTVS